jgi:hypothetical protein
LNTIFNFIGAESLRNIRNKERNPIHYERKIAEAERKSVFKFFEKDIGFLEDLLGWDCSSWKL